MRGHLSVKAHGVFYDMIRRGLIQRDAESGEYRITAAGRELADLAIAREVAA